jgi:hypothetical protein
MGKLILILVTIGLMAGPAAADATCGTGGSWRPVSVNDA